MAKNHYIIPFFVPHLGCPHDCIFCNQRSITGKGQVGNQDLAITQKIAQYLTTIPQDPARTGWPAPGIRVEAAFYGGSFTGIPLDQQRELLEPAQKALKQGYIQGIRISTRPDYISEPILEFLKQFGVSTIELGIQSMDQEVLTKANRGHTVEDVVKAIKIIKEDRGFHLGLQMMVGLPGDSEEKALATAGKIAAMSPDFVRIYPALVIQDTILENLFRQKRYKPLELEEAVKICAQILKVFNKAQIPVIRVGLQPTEEIREGSQVIAGPFHPAFRELVEGELAKERLEGLIKRILGKAAGKKEVAFLVPPRDISVVTGQKRRNIIDLEARYGIKIKLITEPSMARGELRHKN